MKSELQNYIARPKRYDNIDGTGEMVVGLILWGYALAGYLEALLPQNASTRLRVVVILAALMLALGLAFGVRRAIKRFITWPRTGYVAYPRRGLRWWITTVIVRLIVILAVVGFAFLIKTHHVMGMVHVNWNLGPKVWNLRVVLLIIISVAAYPIWMSRTGGKHRWKWIVCLSMVMGVGILAVTAPGDFGQWARPPVLLVGMLWLGSAAGTLYSYVRHTKSAAPEPE